MFLMTFWNPQVNYYLLPILFTYIYLFKIDLPLSNMKYKWLTSYLAVSHWNCISCLTRKKAEILKWHVEIWLTSCSPGESGSCILHPTTHLPCCSPPVGTTSETRIHCEELFKNEYAEDFLIHIHYPLTCSPWISQNDTKLITSGQMSGK